MSSFPNPINNAVVGQQIQAFAYFYLEAGEDTSGYVATYDLLDYEGDVWTQGSATSVIGQDYGGRHRINASASVNVPWTLPVEFFGTKYQLVWTLYKDDGVTVASSYVESFDVKPESSGGVFGVPDIVEANTDSTELMAVLNSTDVVQLIVYRQNSPIIAAPFEIQPGQRVFNGTQYKALLPHSQLAATVSSGAALYGENSPQAYFAQLAQQASGSPAPTSSTALIPSLEPYILYWQYVDEDSGEQKIEDSYLYHVTPMILMAARELQSRIVRANNVGRLPELSIDLNVCIHFLKQGCDYFNGVGMPTAFNFTSATGPIRMHWVTCAAILLLRSQYLMEAERSMVMQGQSVALDIDISSHYQTMADEYQQFIDTYLPELKSNLNRKGILDGDGDYAGGGGALSKNVGGIGIQLSPVTNLYFGYRNLSRRRGLY